MEIKPNYSHTNCDIFAEKKFGNAFLFSLRKTEAHYPANGPQIVNLKQFHQKINTMCELIKYPWIKTMLIEYNWLQRKIQLYCLANSTIIFWRRQRRLVIIERPLANKTVSSCCDIHSLQSVKNRETNKPSGCRRGYKRRISPLVAHCLDSLDALPLL